MKTAAKTSLKIFSILGIFGALIDIVILLIIGGPFEIGEIIDIAAFVVLILICIFSLLALGINTKGFMTAIGVVACITVVGFPYGIFLITIARYELPY